jgi:hypothetical protein
LVWEDGMKLGTWLGLAALVCAAGCSSSGKKTANQGDSKAVSEALTTGITVEHGKKLAGVIPKATADDVEVTQPDEPLTLAPKGDAIMSLDADNPDEDSDPVEAMLMQFEDSDEHFEADVEAGEGDGGTADGGTGTKHYQVHFTINDSICKNFCKGSFDGAMVAALKLKKGGVSKHLTRRFKLDCREEGAETCEKDKDNGKKDAGGGGSSGGGGDGADAGGDTGGGSTTGIAQYRSGLLSFSTQSCACAKSKKKPFCETDGAGLSETAVDCVIKALNSDPTGTKAWVACAASKLTGAATSCGGATCADPANCDAAAAVAAGDTCTQPLPDDVQSAFDACKLGEAPAAP